MLDDPYVHDGLTGLYNRFGLQRFGPEIYSRMLRKYGSAQILFTDMDGMKEINDTFSHDAGDTALRAVSEILRSRCSGEDFHHALRRG